MCENGPKSKHCSYLLTDKVDFSGFIQDKSIQQVEMEDVSEEVEVVKEKSNQEQEGDDDEDEEAVSFKKLEQVFTVKLPSKSAAEIDSDDEPCFGF